MKIIIEDTEGSKLELIVLSMALELFSESIKVSKATIVELLKEEDDINIESLLEELDNAKQLEGATNRITQKILKYLEQLEPEKTYPEPKWE